MPAKVFLIPKKVEKRFAKLPRHIQKRLPQEFIALKENPLLGEKLHGEASQYRKYRIGDYRIIYEFHSKESLLEVIAIEHRQGVYK